MNDRIKYGIMIALGLTGIGLVVWKRRAIINWMKEPIRYFINKSNEIMLQTIPDKKDKNTFITFIDKVNKAGFDVIITSAYRSLQKQEELHKQNPSASTAGNSPHNFGKAIDLNLIDKVTDKRYGMDTPVAEWKKTGVPEIAEKLGLTWGGLFSSYGKNADPVHFDVFGTANYNERVAIMKKLKETTKTT